jgi:hypothetical protein
MMAMKLDPDKVLGMAGIGPKSMEAITTALENVSFPEPALPVEPVVPEMEVLPGAIVETAVETQEPMTEGAAPVESLAELVPVETEVVPLGTGVAEELEGRPLEEIFTLKPDMLHPVTTTTEEEEDDSDKKKEKKKKKKVVEVVYDEDLDKTIAKKKHKRGDEGWEEE